MREGDFITLSVFNDLTIWYTVKASRKELKPTE